MPVFSVNADLCRMDGICASVCPAQVIKGPAGVLPIMRKGADVRCISCGHCIAFCPHGAVHIDTLSDQESYPINRAMLPDAPALDMLCKSRRSIRRFKEAPVPKEVILEILETARYAPSAKNLQPVRWIVVTEREKFQELGNCMATWFEAMLADTENPMPVAEAKGLLRAWRSGADVLFRGAPLLIMAVTPNSWKWGAVDAAIALTYMELAALTHGVGACWAGYATLATLTYAPMRDCFGISNDENIVGGQMLGYPGLRPRVVPPRNPLQIDWM